MGTTAGFGLRYPEPTDKVADGALAIRNLAEDVDADLAAEVTRANAAYLGVNAKAADSNLLDGLDSLAFVTHALADAKGDLAAASGPDTFGRLPVGADGQVLTADAAAALGVKWAAAAASGLDPAKIAFGQVFANEATTATAYADLTTLGPDASVTVGASGRLLVIAAATMSNNTAGQAVFASVELSGANAVAASDLHGFAMSSITANQDAAAASVWLFTGLAAGVTLARLRYKVSGGTGAFSRRRLVAIPL